MTDIVRTIIGHCGQCIDVSPYLFLLWRRHLFLTMPVRFLATSAFFFAGDLTAFFTAAAFFFAGFAVVARND